MRSLHLQVISEQDAVKVGQAYFPAHLVQKLLTEMVKEACKAENIAFKPRMGKQTLLALLCRQLFLANKVSLPNKENLTRDDIVFTLQLSFSCTARDCFYVLHVRF